MGGLPLPKLQRCCFCTRKLKVACILIAIWSMLAITHSMRILFCPACVKLYTKEGGSLNSGLTIMMWILFVINVAALSSSFFYLLALFLHKYPVSADLFMTFGILSAFGMLIHAILNAIRIISINCNNPSDSFAHIMYFALWMYFILIVNSYRDSMLYLFHWLPQWQKCLYCISKQVGCTIIGVFYLCLTYDAFSSTVSSSEKLKCYFKGPLQIILGCLAFACWCLTLTSSILFIYGITKNQLVYLLLFMYTTMLLIGVNMIQSFMMLFYFYREHSCPMPFLFGGANFFGAVVIMYFLVIVNSLYLNIVEKQNLNVIVQSSQLASQAVSQVASQAVSQVASQVASKLPSEVPSVTRATATKPAKSSWFW